MRMILFIAMKAVSVRCPGKNIKLMDIQKELLCELRDSNNYEMIICTDCPIIQGKADQLNISWINRPRYTTWQGGGSFKVQLYAADKLDLKDCDIFIDLNICHLGMDKDTIDRVANLSNVHKTTIISVERSTVPPQKQFFIRNHNLVPVMGFEMSQYQMTTQLLEPTYITSGVNAIPVNQLKQYGSIYNDKAIPIIVDPTKDVDYRGDI